MKQTQFMIYCAYPYSKDPLGTTLKITQMCKEIYEVTHARGLNDLLLMVPHNIFDKVFNFPVGYSNAWMAFCELTLISKCDAIAYDPDEHSVGVVWEVSFAQHQGIPVCTYAELKAGWRPGMTQHVPRFKFRRKWTDADAKEFSERPLSGNLAETLERAQERGTKFDSGKPMIDLIVPEFIVGMAKILTMGAEKYGTENWKRGLEYSRLYAALQRHALAYHSGEHYDSESGLNHMLHVACNAMFIFWYKEVYKNAVQIKKNSAE